MATTKKLPKELFTLSKEETDLSMMLYNKIIKCLVAPYHTAKTIEIEYDPHTYLFPENDMSAAQCKQMISLVASNPAITEARIVTTNIDIIRDMADGCVRILTERGDIVPSPEKTFMANQHTIIYCLLNNEAHQISKDEKNKMYEWVNNIIDRVNKSNPYSSKKPIPMSQAEYDELSGKIDLIGEQLIRHRLRDMLQEAIREK